MERGESSRMAYLRGLSQKGIFICFDDDESQATWDLITLRHNGGPPRKTCNSWIFGYQSEGYALILNRGWLAERRVLECNGRVYMYYYDRSGRQYAKWKHAKEAMRLETAREEGEERLQGGLQQTVPINRGEVQPPLGRPVGRQTCEVPRPVGRQRVRRSYCCSVCNGEWHNVRTCPMRTFN